ncbi:MAG: ATP-binding protein [Planctomycetaceae bacterium]|nr:ATP-binding protein [Planctomycetaceae bacterium]
MPDNLQKHGFEPETLRAAAARLPSFEEALARLLYLVEHRRPCGIVFGQAGTGKSVLLEALHEELTMSESAGATCRPLLINRRLGRSEEGFAWSLATAMGLSPQDGMPRDVLWRAIEDRLEGAALAGQSIIPIFDHLDVTDPQTVGDLRRCGDLAVQTRTTIVLSARPTLGTALATVVGSLCDLKVELTAWTRQETNDFVTNLHEAMPDLSIADDAFDEIHASARGRMRDTVQLLRLAVFAARAQDVPLIDADLIQTVASEIWQPVSQLAARSSTLPSSAVLASASE